MSKAFDQAMALLRQIPPPPDVFARLETLRSGIDPDEQDRFGDLFEGALAAMDTPPPAPPIPE